MGKNMTRSSISILKTGLTLALAVLVSTIATTGSYAESSKTNSAAAKMTAPVDVNSADLKTLETLPGVGAATAKKNVDGRPYSSLADLQKVKGLSKSRVEAMKDLVTFGSATTNAPAAVEAPAKKLKKSAATTASAAAPSSTSSTPASSTTASGASGSSHASAAAGTLAAGEKVNINTATTEELDKIPGIGPAKAQAIVDYRTQNGNFKTIEDVEKVKGIKSGVFSKIKDYIKVSD